jgi:hypothetical protein
MSGASAGGGGGEGGAGAGATSSSVSPRSPTSGRTSDGFIHALPPVAALVVLALCLQVGLEQRADVELREHRAAAVRLRREEVVVVKERLLDQRVQPSIENVTKSIESESTVR